MPRTKKEDTSKEEKKDISEIKQEVKNEVLEYVNKDLKNELNTYIESEVKKDFADILEKKHKKELRRKTRKIVVRDMIIVILLVVIGIMCLLLYEGENISIGNINKQEETNKKEVVDKEPTLDELKEKYASYLDYYFISENSSYIEDLYSKSFNEPLKLNLVMNNIDFQEFEVEDDYYVIDQEIIKDKYEELFNEEFKPISFEYNGNKVRYFNKLESFVTDSVFDKNTSNIKREIIEIKDGKDNFSITTKEGLIIENELYNPKTRELITDEYSGNILDYSDSLETVTYIFKKNKLIRVE